MQLLIDTNILIHLEDYKEINELFAKFYKLSISNNYTLCYHPDCLKDIHRDSNEERRKITLSKLMKYQVMEDPGAMTDEFKSKVGESNENDKVDNVLLFQVEKDYVDYLITEDKGIRSKAEKIGLRNKVRSVSEILEFLIEKNTLSIPQHPLLIHCSVREIEQHLHEPFFDSLCESYDGFNKWFQKCAKENRKCYLLKVEENISALLIYHKEKPSDHLLQSVATDAIKMCTLKVAETAFGYRLGELFLNKMFEYCILGSIDHLYLTVFPHHHHLIELLLKYGFQKHEFKNKHGLSELRMIKDLSKPKKDSIKQAITSHPFYFDDESINKFVVPIDPKYYFTLFKDGSYRGAGLFDNTETSLSEIEGNTISKAYLCKSKSLIMKKGDLLFFYGSKDIGAIEPVGVLDQLEYTKDLELIKNLVKRKTVYKETDFDNMIKGKKEITVLIFRLIYYLRNPIRNNEIKALESYSNKFQTITHLKQSDYLKLKSKKYFNERYIIN